MFGSSSQSQEFREWLAGNELDKRGQCHSRNRSSCRDAFALFQRFAHLEQGSVGPHAANTGGAHFDRIQRFQVDISDVVCHARLGDGLNGFLQRFVDDVCHVSDECRVRVQCWASPPVRYAGFFRQFPVLNIDFLQRLDVFADETDRNNHEIAHPLRTQIGQHIVGVRSQPLDWSDSRLVAKMDFQTTRCGILQQLGPNLVHALDDLLLVRISGFDVRFGHAVGRKQHVQRSNIGLLLLGLLDFGCREAVQFVLDEVRHRIDVPASLVPTWHDGVHHVAVPR
mmetsp:Transcript_23946/g.67574  ORF Transcript_23946/g.67574 Transcript_23946/m.67574 type:complete len:282 (+) Transcript_23946:98-943(+)